MKCPHCHTVVNLEEYGNVTFREKDYEQTGKGYELYHDHCPACGEFVVVLRRGSYQHATGGYESLTDVSSEEVLYPKHVARPVEKEVPTRYRNDYLEACAVVSASPKASAALSRRILQDVLRQEVGITAATLAQEIEAFIQRPDVPSYLADAVDAVRNIGNLAAHPLKDTNTGEIQEVDPGEAEWLLEVNESLFDFVFVQPKRLQERKAQLNARLESMGKPPMKGKKANS